MKRMIYIIVFLTAFAGCIKEDNAAADLKTGDSLPDFMVKMNDGSIVTDDMLKESISVIMFFHTSCPDCQEVLPRMQMIYDEYIAENVLFALISRAEGIDDIMSFWNENALEMPFSAQNDMTVYKKFAGSRIPRVYINEKGGIIRYMFTDDPTPSYDDLKSALEDVIH